MHSVPASFWVGLLVVALPFLFYTVQVGRRKKNQIKFKTKRLCVALGFYLGGTLVLVQIGYRPHEAVTFGFVLGIAAGFFFVRPPVRRRVVPRHIRRAVIERDLKGQAFDPKLHHLDHIVPFSRGGDHSVANLRVMAKTENLRRGARMPRFRDLF